MIVFPDRLWAYIKEQNYTVETFAKACGLEVSEVWQLLMGEAVGITVARKFINTLGAETVRPMIDWEAIKEHRKANGE